MAKQIDRLPNDDVQNNDEDHRYIIPKKRKIHRNRRKSNFSSTSSKCSSSSSSSSSSLMTIMPFEISPSSKAQQLSLSLDMMNKIPLILTLILLLPIWFCIVDFTLVTSIKSTNSLASREPLSLAPEATRRLLTEHPLNDHDDDLTSDKVDYTNHSIIRIANRDIGLLFNDQDDDGNGDNVDDNHEVLWYDNSHQNQTQYAYVRVGPKRLNRIKRDLRYLREQPMFITSNLQSWLDAEHQHFPPKNNFVISPTDDDDFIEGEEEDEPPYNGPTAQPLTGYPIHHSKIVPSFVLSRYQPLSQVQYFMNEVAKKWPRHVTVFTIGYTHEKRPIQAIEIINNPNDPNFFWIDGCTHSREWVTVTTALYIIEQAVLSKVPVNFIIVPVLNVDGYVYTWTKDRMWRKNRRPYDSSRLARSSLKKRCSGVDLNRNYDINFGGAGSSKNPCSVLYQGPYPFSEPEVRAARDLLLNNRHRIKMTLSLHSFNQLWSCPNAFTNERTKDYNYHMRVLKSIQQAVRSTNGVLYDIGPLGSRLYLGSGFMMDWIYHKLGIKDAYLVELRDRGFYGFILPADQIWPTATETWQGILAAIGHVFL